MEDTTGGNYYTGQICRGSVALGSGCKKCEKCKEEMRRMEVKEEQLYICDHVVICNKTKNKKCKQREPHVCNNNCTYECIDYRDAKCIPYTEEKELKTKRMAIIEFYGRLSNTEFISIVQRDKDMKMISEVMVADIDPERLRYGVPGKNDNVMTQEGLNGGGFRQTNQNWSNFERLILDPPTPEPETVDQVLDRMPDPEDKSHTRRAMFEFLKDLKAAQERSK